MPSVKIERASTVAVVVPSPSTSEVLEATSFTICAPMFSNLSSSSISLATVTPSLVTVGAPKLFSNTTLRPLGPSVTVTASASTLTPLRIFSRASWEKRTSFAGMIYLHLLMVSGLRPSAFQHPKNVVFTKDQVLFPFELDFTAGVFAEQDAVTCLYIRWHQLAVLSHLAFAN